MKKKNIIFSIVALLLASCNNANNDNSKTDESENAKENTSGLICKDGIVAVVNSKNTTLENITAAKLKMIYQTGANWSDVVA